MDLKQLGYFAHVAELGSFTKAAALLSVAQSALSHQVRQLEVELKQTLLIRNGRGVAPTDAGKLMQVDRARDDLAESRGAPVGNVVLGLPASIARSLALPLLKAFRRAFPNASLGIVEGLSAYIVESLVAGRVDIGLVYNAAPGPAIEIHPLHEQEMFLISSRRARQDDKRRSVPTQTLPRYPLIIPSRPNANRMRIETLLADCGLRPRIAYEIDAIASILDLVHEGFGYAILPLDSLRGHAHARSLDASPIVKPKLSIHMSLVVSSQRPATPLTTAMLALTRTIALQTLPAKR